MPELVLIALLMLAFSMMRPALVMVPELRKMRLLEAM